MVKCSKCSTEVKGGVKFCPECGIKIEHNNANTELNTNEVNLHIKTIKVTPILLSVLGLLIIAIIVFFLFSFLSPFAQILLLVFLLIPVALMYDKIIIPFLYKYCRSSKVRILLLILGFLIIVMLIIVMPYFINLSINPNSFVVKQS